MTMFIEIPEFNANSVDPNQTSRSAASDLGLHCLPMSPKWDAKLKWVKLFCFVYRLNNGEKVGRTIIADSVCKGKLL